MIAVTTIDNIGLGTLQPGRGFSLYPVKYKVSWGIRYNIYQDTNQDTNQDTSLVVFAGNSVPSIQGRGTGCRGNQGQQGGDVHSDRPPLLFRLQTRKSNWRLQTCRFHCLLFCRQSIPPEMEFDPNSTPPSYSTADQV